MPFEILLVVMAGAFVFMALVMLTVSAVIAIKRKDYNAATSINSLESFAHFLVVFLCLSFG